MNHEALIKKPVITYEYIREGVDKGKFKILSDGIQVRVITKSGIGFTTSIQENTLSAVDRVCRELYPNGSYILPYFVGSDGYVYKTNTGNAAKELLESCANLIHNKTWYITWCDSVLFPDEPIATQPQVDALIALGFTASFQMFDDDGIHYYSGYSLPLDKIQGFEPLDDFGMPNAGCTEIRYLNSATHTYETL